MNRQFLDAIARQHALSAPVVAQVAAAIAERCALIANREGSALATDDGGPLGAHIGAAILSAFAEEPATKPASQ